MPHVVDPDGNGDPNDAGAMWLPGETFIDAANGISVKVTRQTTNGFDVTIDTTPPTIVSRTPADGQTGASRYTNVTPTFSEDMDASTANAFNVQRYEDGADGSLDATVHCDNPCRTATLDPLRQSAWRTEHGTRSSSGETRPASRTRQATRWTGKRPSSPGDSRPDLSNNSCWRSKHFRSKGRGCYAPALVSGPGAGRALGRGRTEQKLRDRRRVLSPTEVVIAFSPFYGVFPANSLQDHCPTSKLPASRRFATRPTSKMCHMTDVPDFIGL